MGLVSDRGGGPKNTLRFFLVTVINLGVVMIFRGPFGQFVGPGEGEGGKYERWFGGACSLACSRVENNCIVVVGVSSVGLVRRFLLAPYRRMNQSEIVPVRFTSIPRSFYPILEEPAFFPLPPRSLRDSEKKCRHRSKHEKSAFFPTTTASPSAGRPRPPPGTTGQVCMCTSAAA